MLKREGVEDRFHNVELRIGNESIPTNYEYSPITINTVAGDFGTGTTETMAVYEVDPPISGRFITLQAYEWSYLEVDEINVDECVYV